MGQLMTQAEAGYKWCRHTRRLDYHRYGEGLGATGINRSSNDSVNCKGEGCASWDWWDEEDLGDKRRGYCGADRIKPNKVGNNGKGN